MLAATRVAPSLNPSAGRGLFAASVIFRNDVVAEYDGPIISSEAFSHLPPRIRAYGIYISSGRVMDARRGKARFANSPHHDPLGRRANVDLVVFRGKAYLRARRYISRGEEILVHYGASYNHFS